MAMSVENEIKKSHLHFILITPRRMANLVKPLFFATPLNLSMSAYKDPFFLFVCLLNVNTNDCYYLHKEIYNLKFIIKKITSCTERLRH